MTISAIDESLSMRVAVWIMPHSNLDLYINATLICQNPNCENWPAYDQAG